MSKKKTKQLVQYFTKQASLSELDELSKWIENPPNREEFDEYIKINYAIDFNIKNFGTEDSKKQLLEFIEGEKKVYKLGRTLSVVKYAAAVLLFLGLGYFYKSDFFVNKSARVGIEEIVSEINNDKIEVGSDKATLTLADGSDIVLENGKVIQTRNVESNGEKLIYKPRKNPKTAISYNYLTIPRGGQFQLKLSDGTLVWLNSESRLKYPVAFNDGETRKVELVYGEAYFEVSPSTQHNGATFKVLSRSQEIEVLGTEFNVKAYKDESNIYTTLINGKVVITTATAKKILAPNQQANMNLKNNHITINPVADVKSEISWKKGLFSFKGKPLKEIAKVLERWYDVEIVFSRPALENINFNGVLSKNETIEEILKSILTTNSIKAYDIENKRITIQ